MLFFDWITKITLRMSQRRFPESRQLVIRLDKEIPRKGNNEKFANEVILLKFSL